jgi:SMP-30/Gluconolactonase/LRE-like region
MLPPESAVKSRGATGEAMAEARNLLTLTNLGHVLDHPEAVAWGSDQKVYAGGEAGQLYRTGIADSAPRCRCNRSSDALGRDAVDAGIAVVAGIGVARGIMGEAQQESAFDLGDLLADRMRVPNYPVFDDAGNLFVSDSGEWGKKNGWIWKIAPGGAAAIWCKSACGFTNGMCLSADGKALYVVESSPPLISKVAIRPDGTAGERTVLVELPRQVPDGVALDAKGDLYISLYNPNTIYRYTVKGQLITLYDDWEQLNLVAPTNIAFGGADMQTLIIASLCGWSVHTAPMPVPGLKVRYPKTG